MYDRAHVERADNMIKYVNDKIRSGEVGVIWYSMLLHGNATFKLETVPNAGHNMPLILSRIYEYDKKFPEDNQRELFEKAIAWDFKNMGTYQRAYQTADIIFAQLQNEKNGDASFRINGIEMLKGLAEAVVNDDILKSQPGGEKFLDHVSDYAQEKYNISIK